MGDEQLASRARLIRIEDTRADDPAFLDSLLRSADPSLRGAAATAVGRLGARPHLPALRRLAADPDTGVAASAFFALGLLKDSAAVVAATSALRASEGVSMEAAWLLGQVGESGRAALVGAAIDTALGARRRGAAILALARIRQSNLQPLAPLLADPDTAIAWRAAYVLARYRNPAVVRALMGAARSTSPEVRDQAARGLARSLAGDSLAAPALELLRQMALDSSARVRVVAVRALAGYGPSAAEAIRTALRDPDPAVRLSAAGSAHLVLDSNLTAWRDAWRAETAFVIRRALAESAVRRRQRFDDWTAWRTDTAWRSRAAAAELDGLGPATVAFSRLALALGDRDARVRAAAASALRPLTDSASVSPFVRARLLDLLTDTDFLVRANTMTALARGATPGELSAAIATYPLAQRDADSDARLAFWTMADSALTGARAALPDSVDRALAALPRPIDRLERLRASSIARFGAWRDSTGTARPSAWYEERAREALSERAPIARIETERGRIDLDLFVADAPMTVHNFVQLARSGYFDGQRFHRVVPNFVVQGGDPRGDGSGGPGHAIRDELNRHRYGRGALGMALSGPDTGGSQFFVTHSPQPHLDAGYTVFGQLRAGGDVLDRIVQGDRIVRITIH